ncbi:hypothetical protein L6452_00589 [Arctium lappa]|uniref:Uncharacterized protein n=1 Tax=Arctium lappa TaxID=4217 RepID=A0ACB9FEC6_ARCLA|nr:hypothetical protein L6452_00589 [Arctium lappa]
MLESAPSPGREDHQPEFNGVKAVRNYEEALSPPPRRGKGKMKFCRTKKKKENPSVEIEKGLLEKNVDKGKDERGIGESSKNKRNEGEGLGRGKMSFHMIKQMVRASTQKYDSTTSRTTDQVKVERSKKRPRVGGERNSKISQSKGMQNS